MKSRHADSYTNPRLYHHHGNINESYDSVELEATDFDDLIFALKTGGTFTPSMNGEDKEVDDHSMVEQPTPDSSPSSGYAIRKIPFGDTHVWPHNMEFVSN